MYFLLGISLAFAFLLIINLLASISANAVWRLVARRVQKFSANVQAQIIFGLRILPVVAAVLFVLAFVIPAYVLYEPVGSGEVVGSKLAIIAVASSFGVLIALFRVFKTWLATRRLTANWLADAVPFAIENVKVPVYRIEHAFPVIAVVGIFRPRLFVAKKVLDSLDEHEFRAAISHEYGHLTAKDNFKRTLLRICRDLLIVPFGKRLDRAWAENAESVADEYAAKSRGGSTALDLASALIKIARIVPANASPAMPLGAFLLEEQSGDITWRVQKLLQFSSGKDNRLNGRPFAYSPIFWLCSALATLILLLPIADPTLLLSVHNTLESIVRILQ